MLLNFCFSPVNLAFITGRGWGSTKNLEGQSENCFSSHTHVMEYYSAAERNAPSTHGKTWINPQYILLSERIQSEEVAHSMTPLMTFRERQSYIDDKQIMGWGI